MAFFPNSTFPWTISPSEFMDKAEFAYIGYGPRPRSNSEHDSRFTNSRHLRRKMSRFSWKVIVAVLAAILIALVTFNHRSISKAWNGPPKKKHVFQTYGGWTPSNWTAIRPIKPILPAIITQNQSDVAMGRHLTEQQCLQAYPGLFEYVLRCQSAFSSSKESLVAVC